MPLRWVNSKIGQFLIIVKKFSKLSEIVTLRSRVKLIRVTKVVLRKINVTGEKTTSKKESESENEVPKKKAKIEPKSTPTKKVTKKRVLETQLSLRRYPVRNV